MPTTTLRISSTGHLTSTLLAALAAGALALGGCGGGSKPAQNGGSGGAHGTGGAGLGGSGASTATPLSLTITLHLENDPPYDAEYAAALRSFAATFEAHGGRLTFEPRQETLMGTTDVRTAFADLEAVGHAVGSHAAVGTMTGLTQASFNMQVASRRTALLGVVQRVDHVSGVCSTLDFVQASTTGGFSYTTGATAYCLLAMAPADRPAGYENLACAAATDAACHTSYPSAIAERIHPWRAASAAHWLTDDPTGGLVVFPGSGTLPCLEEEAASTGSSLTTCTLTDGDVALAMADLDDAIAHVDANRVNTFYWIWGSWKRTGIDAAVLGRFLAAVDERIARGQVQWKTVAAMHDDYVAWESTHR